MSLFDVQKNNLFRFYAPNLRTLRRFIVHSF